MTKELNPDVSAVPAEPEEWPEEWTPVQYEGNPDWMQGLRTLQHLCWKTSDDHGWHQDVDDPRIFVEKLCLIHSEVSEALEEYRDGRGFTETYYREEDGKPEGIPVELADVLIRLLDLAGIYGIDLAAATAEKQLFNETRAYRHGGKAA